MKKNLALTFVCFLTYTFLFAQQRDYKVVFDVTSKDTLVHQTAIRQMGLIARTSPDARLELVLFGQSLSMVIKDKSTVGEEIQKLLENKNVSFKVCAFTMQRYKIDKSQLITGVEIVPDGIYEIVTRQREGWGYIKVTQ